MKKVAKDYKKEIQIKTGYEAGCLGYSPHDLLEKQGIDCDILAPLTMYSSSKNRVVKNDRLDAKIIVLDLANNTYKPVYVPDEEYIRMMKDFKTSLRKIKQQVKAFLLRHGLVYDGKSSWMLANLKWLKGLKLTGLLKETLEEYLLQYDVLTGKIECFSQKIEELSHERRYEKPVAQLHCLKGVIQQQR